jgi:ABC-2 type transport system ATP-binding protein
MTTDVPNPGAVRSGGIELSGLTKTFRTGKEPVRAVRGIDISIAAGETVALLGPNGAGKSTTIDMLLGLLPPDAGTVSIFGASPRDAISRGVVGAMLQTGQVLRDLTVRELVDMMGSLFPQPFSTDETLQMCGIEDIADRRTQKLSGGQSQRVRFAVALVSNPDLLVLDEPTVAMDVEARREFWGTMRKFTESGRTVIFATHYLEEADAYADRIILMAHGEIVADGPSTEIKATVGMRTIRATLPGADLAAIGALPGVSNVDTRGESVVINCSDSDVALRAFLPAFPSASDIEVSGAGLEEAFLQLTADSRAETTEQTTAGANR